MQYRELQENLRQNKGRSRIILAPHAANDLHNSSCFSESVVLLGER
jgi:hypothetical protein